VKPANFTPMFPGGWAGVQAGAAIIFFSFIGFDAVSTAAEETRNPKRDIPVGILGSLFVCTLIYVAVAAVLVGIMPWTSLGIPDPLAAALAFIGKDWAAGVVSFGAVVAMTAVLLVFQLGQPRIFFSMSRDGLLPRLFSAVHPRYKTPHVTTIWTGVFVAVCASFTALDEIIALTNIGTLFAFVLVCLGVIILRFTDPGRPRPFRIPWVPLLPIWAVILWFLPGAFAASADWGARAEYTVVLIISLCGVGFSLTGLRALVTRTPVPEWVRTEFALAGIASCVYLMRGLPGITWWRFLGWLALGLFIYAIYGARHSRLLPRTRPLPAPVRLAAPAVIATALLAWGLLPAHAGLIAAIVLLFAFSCFALWRIERQAA
jgi:amino acid transporter